MENTNTTAKNKYLPSQNRNYANSEREYGWGRASNRRKRQLSNDPYGRPRSDHEGLQNIIENEKNLEGSVLGKLRGYAFHAFSGIPWVSRLAKSGGHDDPSETSILITGNEKDDNSKALVPKVSATPRRSRRLVQTQNAGSPRGEDQEEGYGNQGPKIEVDQDRGVSLNGQRVEDMTVFILKRHLKDLGCETHGLKKDLQSRLRSKALEIANTGDDPPPPAKLRFGAMVSPEAPKAPKLVSDVADFRFNLPVPSAEAASPAGDTLLEKAVPLDRRNLSAAQEPEEEEFQDALGSPEQEETWQSGGEPSSSARAAILMAAGEAQGTSTATEAIIKNNAASALAAGQEEDQVAKEQPVGDATSPLYGSSSHQPAGLMAPQRRSSALALTIKPKTPPPDQGNQRGPEEPKKDAPEELPKAGLQEETKMIESKDLSSSLNLVVAPRPRHMKTPIDVVKTLLGRVGGRRRALPSHWSTRASSGMQPGPYQELHGMGSAFHAPKPRPPKPPAQPAPLLLAQPKPRKAGPSPAASAAELAMVAQEPSGQATSNLPYLLPPTQEPALTTSRKRSVESMQRFARFTEDQEEEPILNEIRPAKRHRSYVPSLVAGLEDSLDSQQPGTNFSRSTLFSSPPPFPSSSSKAPLPHRRSLAPTGNFSLGGGYEGRTTGTPGGLRGVPANALTQFGGSSSRRHSIAGGARATRTPGSTSRRRARNVAPAVSGAIAQRILQALQETTSVPKLQQLPRASPYNRRKSSGDHDSMPPPPPSSGVSPSFHKSPSGVGSGGVPLDRKTPQVEVGHSPSTSPRTSASSSILRADTSKQPSPFGSAFRFAPGVDNTPDGNKVPGMLNFGTPTGPAQDAQTSSKIVRTDPKTSSNKPQSDIEPQLVPGVPGSEFLFQEPAKAPSEVDPPDLDPSGGDGGPRFAFSPAGKRRRSSLTGRTPRKTPRKAGALDTPAKGQASATDATKLQPGQQDTSKAPEQKEKSDPKITSDLPPLCASMFTDPTNWKCDTCMASNKKDFVKCACCEAYKPGTAPSEASGGSAPAPSGSDFKTTSFPASIAKTSGSIGAGGFSFGASKIAEKPKDGVPAASASIGVGGFTFGKVSSASTTSENKDDAPAPKTGLIFGSKPSNSTSAGSGALTFGGGISKPEGSAPAPAPSESGFKFGSGFSSGTKADADTKSSTVSGGFSFAKKADSPSKPEKPKDKPAQSAGFLFGSAQKTTKDSEDKHDGNKTPGFSFGKPTSDSKEEAPKGGFSFGNTSFSSAPASKPSAGFSFGGSAGQKTNSKPEEERPSQKKEDNPNPKPSAAAFSFGAGSTPAPETTAKEESISKKKKRGAEDDKETSQPTAPKPTFGFGNTAPGSTPGGFSFGGASQNSSQSSTSAAPSFTFGSANTLTTVSEAPAPAAAPTTPGPVFSFGSTPKPEEKKADQTTPATPAFTFGSSGAPSAPAAGGTGAAFTFGTSKPATPAAPAFGASGSTPGFGASAGGGATTGGFGFGASTPAPATPFGAGATAPTPDSSGMDTDMTNTNGVPGTATPAPTFGGFGQPMPTPPAAPAFTFGTPAAGNTSTAPQFGFGSAATPGAPGAPSFTFGAVAGTPAAASTPAAPPMFGATPTPTAPTPGASGGFSLGATGVKKGRRIVKARRPKK